MTPPTTTIVTESTLPEDWVALPIPTRIYNDAVIAIDRLMNGPPLGAPADRVISDINRRSRFTESFVSGLPKSPPKRIGFIPCSHCGHSPKSHTGHDHSCTVCEGRDTGAGAMYAGDCPGWNGTPGAEPVFERRDGR